MKQPREVVKDWLQKVIDEGRGLTVWETNFIQSISDQFDRKDWLSDEQIDILERIYVTRTP